MEKKNKTDELRGMMKKKQNPSSDGEITDHEIDVLVKKGVKKILELDPAQTDKDIFYMMLSQIKLGMTFREKTEIMKRVMAGHTIRAITFITNDPNERKAYIEASVPELSLAKQVGGK